MFIKNALFATFLLSLTAFFLTFADPITKVLQNGKDGYAGCYDSYTYSFYPDDNYSTNATLFQHNCQN